MTLLQIILATLVGGVFSVLLASLVALTFLARFANRMVAFAVGVLLGFALTDILPEAVNLGLDIVLRPRKSSMRCNSFCKEQATRFSSRAPSPSVTARS